MVEAIVIVFVLIFFLGVIASYFVGLKLGTFRRDVYWKEQIPGHRKDAILRSRSVIGGQFSEQLAPILPGFNYLPNECRFIGKPVDFLVFRGMDGKSISEVVFVEVKSGGAKLSTQEKSLKEAVENKKVRFEEYRVPDGLLSDNNFEIPEF